MFFFFPQSVRDLKKNGYVCNDTTSFYTKKTGDTLESIREVNEEKGLFSKHFYIKREPEEFKKVTDDSLKSMLDYIIRNADEVIFNYEYCKIIRFKKYSFFLVYGYSAKRTYYLIHYYNLSMSSDRTYCVEYLEGTKSIYTDSTDRAKIDSVVAYIKNFKG